MIRKGQCEVKNPQAKQQTSLSQLKEEEHMKQLKGNTLQTTTKRIYAKKDTNK